MRAPRATRHAQRRSLARSAPAENALHVDPSTLPRRVPRRDPCPHLDRRALTRPLRFDPTTALRFRGGFRAPSSPMPALTTVPGPPHRAGPTHFPRAHPRRSPGDPFRVPGSGTNQKLRVLENSRGCGRCGEARRPSQARLLHLALLRLSKGCGQPRRVRAYPLARARRARLSTTRHRPQSRSFRGNALRLRSRHVSAEVSAISIRGPGSLASACRTHSPTPDLL